jgi:hypothetical protein
MSNQDQVLKFSNHDLGIHCYNGVKNVRLVYAGSPHTLCTTGPGLEKTAADENEPPNGSSGSYKAFAGPVEIDWLARDGSALHLDLDLDAIFKDRIVLHKADPARIYQPKPITGGEPLIVVEVIDRTVNVYMSLQLQLVRAEDPEGRREGSDQYTLAYSKTL